jgi:cell division protein ftsH
MGPERKSKVVPEDEKRVVAYHEVGHGIVGYIIGGGDRVHKITMIPRGPAGGYTLSLPEEEKSFHSKKYMLNRIARYFGGRAAEEIIFGKENITDGAGSDIYYATSIAKNIVTKYGMTEKFGPVFLEATEEDYMLQRKYYSEQTGKEVDDEIRKIITEQYSRAKNILLENRDKLEEVTRILLEKETIMGPEFEAIMKNEHI